MVPVVVPDYAESRVEGNLLYFKKILTPDELEGKLTPEPEPEFKPMGMSLFWGSDDAKKYETLCRQPIKMVLCGLCRGRRVFEPLVPQVAHDRDTMLLH